MTVMKAFKQCTAEHMAVWKLESPNLRAGSQRQSLTVILCHK